VDSYIAEQSIRTPYINFNPATGVFEMKGKSIPENSILFYKNMFEWLSNYMEHPAPKTTLSIQMDYFNTSSSKSVVDLFKKLESLHKSGKGEVEIVWLHNEEDEDMQEAGEDYKSIIKVPFQIISFK
jgi:SiaC family regulatory phosphoprotein